MIMTLIQIKFKRPKKNSEETFARLLPKSLTRAFRVCTRFLIDRTVPKKKVL